MLLLSVISLTALAPSATGACYTDLEMAKIAGTITDLKKCSLALAEKTTLIETKLAKFDAAPAFWQEPTFIMGGTVVSVSLGAMLGFYLARNH